MIRTATSQDCQSLAALSIQVWLDTYAVEGIKPAYAHYALTTFTEHYFKNLLSSDECKLFICEDDDVLQGYILINLTSHYQSPQNGYEIEKLYIHQKFKGQGLGRKLIAKVQAEFGAPCWLYTWTENASNHFYQHLGFAHIGTLSFEFEHTPIHNNVYAYKNKAVLNG